MRLLTIADDAPVERLIARAASGHAAALAARDRARPRRIAQGARRNIVADMPAGDPLDDATVLFVGRGRPYPTLSVAVGERMGVMGALSIERRRLPQRARHRRHRARRRLCRGTVDAFLTVLAEDARFRDLPVAVLGDMPPMPTTLPNFDQRRRRSGAAGRRAVPLVRLRAFETRLKRCSSRSSARA